MLKYAKLTAVHADVLNRIRWDASIESADFLVGYLDRFDGIVEIDFVSWVRELTEEEFIPQHRIRYLKNTKTQDVVWDRDARIDKIFGSGQSTGYVPSPSPLRYDDQDTSGEPQVVEDHELP